MVRGIVQIDARGLDVAAAAIWTSYLTDAVLRSAQSDPRIRERLARMQELERRSGRQFEIFDDLRRPHALRR